VKGFALVAATVALFAWGPASASGSTATPQGANKPQAAAQQQKKVVARTTQAVRRPSTPSYNCVQYVRMVSPIQLSGDAWKWWDSAAGAFQRGSEPKPDAVMVFGRTGGMQRGHVAVVRQVVGDREMIIDHANWGNARGRIATGVRVVDVSARGDWSQVRVWHTASDVMGNKVYPIRGFVYAAPQQNQPEMPVMTAPFDVQEAAGGLGPRGFQMDSAARYGG
jgi:surface antigen